MKLLLKKTDFKVIDQALIHQKWMLDNNKLTMHRKYITKRRYQLSMKDLTSEITITIHLNKINFGHTGVQFRNQSRKTRTKLQQNNYHELSALSQKPP